MFRFSKLALSAAALFALSLAAATRARAVPIAYTNQTTFNTVAGSTTSNDFQSETVSSPVDYQASLTSMGITFAAGSGSTVGFVNGASSPNFGLATGNTALFLNGSGIGSSVTITPLANTTAFGMFLKSSSKTSITPGGTTLGQYTVTATTSDGQTFSTTVSSNDFNNFSFVGFATSDGTYITSIVITTLEGGSPLIDDLSFNGAAVTATPEPATMFLFGTGLAGLASFARSRRRGARKGEPEAE